MCEQENILKEGEIVSAVAVSHIIIAENYFITIGDIFFCNDDMAHR